MRASRLVPREPITPSDLTRGKRRGDVELLTKVEPDGHRWRWTVEYVIKFDDTPHIGMCYGGCRTTRHPKPRTVSGRARTRGEAEIRARLSVAAIKSQVAAVHDHLNRTSHERIAS